MSQSTSRSWKVTDSGRGGKSPVLEGRALGARPLTSRVSRAGLTPPLWALGSGLHFCQNVRPDSLSFWLLGPGTLPGLGVPPSGLVLPGKSPTASEALDGLLLPHLDLIPTDCRTPSHIQLGPAQSAGAQGSPHSPSAA